MKLLIVESPTKAKTIEKFLGDGFAVEASYGHIRDLPKSKLGVDIENGFKPTYVIPTKARKKVNELRKKASEMEEVFLATDEDREGEAIAYHLFDVLGLKENKRIVFHEITEEAIRKAISKPRGINMNLVMAQQARRILDRLVGYKLSPFLAKKISKGLSAGRVQSVALRLIVEREEEIKKFNPEEYWTIEGLFLGSGKLVSAKLENVKGKKVGKFFIKEKEKADKILSDIKKEEKWQAGEIEKKKVFKNPYPPFTTSSLQQEAWQALSFTAKKTMFAAQNLYEKGLITYHRTDSLNLSKTALNQAKDYIIGKYGKNYFEGPKEYKTKSKSAQEAHEAIRPTKPTIGSEEILQDNRLGENEKKLYALIWKMFIASQMARASFQAVSLKISAGSGNFSFGASGQKMEFDGFLKVYPIKREGNIIPEVKTGDSFSLKKVEAKQHFTQPPARYNDASLIKKMEDEGIGRPSTYAQIIDTIQKRNYVNKNSQRRFEPTEIGVLVNKILVSNFPIIVDLKFTAKMEENLDKIALGEKKWQTVLSDFYLPFSKKLAEKYEEIKKDGKEIEKTDRICPICGSPLVIRWSRFGKFYACSNFPNCRYKEPLKKSAIGVKCPKCGADIVEKRTRKGKIFYGCSNWPNCDFALWDKPTGETCPECGSLLVEKGKKIICSNKECGFKKDKE